MLCLLRCAIRLGRLSTDDRPHRLCPNPSRREGDLPRRQQTLREAIGWSYGLLDEREKRLFARLGVFLGGWTLEAVETICHEPGEDNLAVLDCLGSLVDKSLVRQLEPPQAGAKNLESRFGMLETLREFAQEKLLESEQANIIR